MESQRTILQFPCVRGPHFALNRHRAWKLNSPGAAGGRLWAYRLRFLAVILAPELARWWVGPEGSGFLRLALAIAIFFTWWGLARLALLWSLKGYPHATEPGDVEQRSSSPSARD